MSQSKKKVPFSRAGVGVHLWRRTFNGACPVSPLSQRGCVYLENWMAYTGTFPHTQNADGDMLEGKAGKNRFFLGRHAEAQHVCDV